MRGQRRVPSAPRPFCLVRHRDVSGVSGIGVVAVGAVFPSGRAVLEWCSDWPTITVFDSVEQIARIHGHGGDTTIRFGAPPRGTWSHGRTRSSQPRRRRVRWFWWRRGGVAETPAVRPNAVGAPAGSAAEPTAGPHT